MLPIALPAPSRRCPTLPELRNGMLNLAETILFPSLPVRIVPVLCRCTIGHGFTSPELSLAALN